MIGLRVSAAVAIAGLFLTGCSSSRSDVATRMPVKVRGMTCDTATAHVTNFGRATTKLYADIAIKNQIFDLHGYMFQSGLRRIRVTQQTSSCQQFGNGALRGAYDCTSRAQLCGI